MRGTATATRRDHLGCHGQRDARCESWLVRRGRRRSSWTRPPVAITTTLKFYATVDAERIATDLAALVGPNLKVEIENPVAEVIVGMGPR